MTKSGIVVAVFVGACLLGLCSLGLGVYSVSSINTSIRSLQSDLAATTAELRQTRDHLEIRKLQSLYQHHMLRGDALAIVGLFADSPDVEIELSNKGVMVGADATRRYFLRLGPGETLPTQNRPRPAGSLILHTAVNPAIEINSEGTKARALWLSPGLTTFPARGGPPSPNWIYGKYEMTYLKQAGEWKILTFRWRQIFYSPSTEGWVAVNLDPGPANPNPDRASEPGFYAPYRPDTVNPYDPPPPQPFVD